MRRFRYQSCVALILMSFLAQQAIGRGGAALRSDFNGDGFDDLAVGIPGKDVNGLENAGALVTITGGPGGLRHDPGHRSFNRNMSDVPGDASAGERWGSVLQTGDFDGDGFHDLAVGAPRSQFNRGTLVVLYGSPGGLGGRSQEFSPTAGVSHVDFGSALGSADFNGDGNDDLAIGVAGAFGDKGAVMLLHGSTDGLSLQSILQRSQLPASFGQVKPELFGAALAGGNFNNDYFGDLAIGAPSYDTQGQNGSSEGRVYFVFGGQSGLNPNAAQAFTQNSDFMQGGAENGDRFATLVVAGDFDGNGVDDAAIGVPFESHEAIPADRGGVVAVVHGFTGITTQNNQLWHQNSPNVPGRVEAGDRFGDQLAAGDFDGDGRSELAIGVPHELFGQLADTGVLHLLRGTTNRLQATEQILMHHDIPALSGFFAGLAADDLFASGLGVGDFDGDGRHDLAIGVPRKDFQGRKNTGAVFVFQGATNGLDRSRAQVWMQEDIVGGRLQSDAGDHFGLSLSGGSGDCSVFTDCASLTLTP